MRLTIEVDVDFLEEGEIIDDVLKESIRKGIVDKIVREVRLNERDYYTSLKEQIVNEAKAYIKKRVDEGLDDIVERIARKKAILELTPEKLDISSEVEKALAKKFSQLGK